MGGFAPSHLLILLLAVIVLFGASRLPEAARGLGRSLRVFKAEVADRGATASAQPPAASPGATTAAAGPAAPAESADAHDQATDAQPARTVDSLAAEWSGGKRTERREEAV